MEFKLNPTALVLLICIQLSIYNKSYGADAAEPISIASSLFGIASALTSIISSIIPSKSSGDSNSGQNVGIYLRLQTDGGLDASPKRDPDQCFWRSRKFSFVTQNSLLEDEPNLKWRFEGPHLVSYHKNEVNKFEKVCLTFQSPVDLVSDYLEVTVTKCRGMKSQRWFLKMHPGQLQPANHIPVVPYFSIHPEAFPKKCLTLKERTVRFEDSINLDVECSSYVVFIRFKPGRLEETYTRAYLNGFFLEECNGCDKQSFFIDVPFLDVMKKFTSEGGSVAKNTDYQSALAIPQAKCSHGALETFSYSKSINNHKRQTGKKWGQSDHSQGCGPEEFNPCQRRCGKLGGWGYNWCPVNPTFIKNVQKDGDNLYKNFNVDRRDQFLWKYCSPYRSGVGELKSSDFDYKGNKCKSDHKCDYYGEDYEWCYLEGGSWGLCSTDYDGSKAPVWTNEFH